MIRRSFCVGLGLVCCALAGCLNSSPLDAPPPGSVEPFLWDNVLKKKEGANAPEHDAMLAVLTKNRELFRSKFHGLKGDTQPRDLVNTLRSYQQEANQFDLSSCPVDFRAAWSRYLKSWVELFAMLERLPSAYEDVQFMDALQYLFRGNTDRGKLLGGDVMAAVKQVTVTHKQLYNTAQTYGIVPME